MPIRSTLSDDKKSLQIMISDRFDYGLHQGFRACYRDLTETGMTYIMDLSQATYMDSSALGMVLLLKEHADSYGGRVVIRKPHSAVEKILRVANFDRFVTIEL